MDYLRAATQVWGMLPRVVLKFGASHMMRGRTFTNVFDLGMLASEVAQMHGGESFGVLMMGGPGSLRAQIDPRDMGTMQIPVDMAQADWAHPFLNAALPEDWTVFDLRPIRPRIRQLGDLSDRLRQVLYGFDALVVLTGSGPQHALELR